MQPGTCRSQVYQNTATAAQPFAGTIADLDRPDFAAEIEADTSDHGYAATIPVAPGARTVCVYAVAAVSSVDAGGGTADALLGCQAVTAAQPAGDT